jgi:hypothetical protein
LERRLISSRLSKVRIVAVAVFCLVAFGGFSGWFINKYFGVEAQALALRIWPPPTTDQVENKQLRRIAGWFSLDCGHVRYRENADRAIACTQDALKARRRFYVAFDYRGLDSHGTTGLAMNSDGAIYEVETDQLTGGWARYVFNDRRVSVPTVIPCKKVPIERTSYPANRYLTCLAESKADQ